MQSSGRLHPVQFWTEPRPPLSPRIANVQRLGGGHLPPLGGRGHHPCAQLAGLVWAGPLDPVLAQLLEGEDEAALYSRGHLPPSSPVVVPHCPHGRHDVRTSIRE